jgi:hypothetical protein
MRCHFLELGVVSALLCSAGLLAQHTGAGTPAPISHMGVVGIRNPAFSGAAHPAPQTTNPAAQIGHSGHPPAWNGGTNGRPGNDQHRGPSRERYPYVYPGLLSFGYGLPVGYGLASGYDDSEASAPAPGQAPSAEEYAPQPPDPQMAESAPSLYRPLYQGPVQAASAPVKPQPATVLIFKDGRPQQQVHNYALTETTLWALDDDTRREIPLADIDVPATVKINRDAGVDFALPGKR